jgi:hypothetical protein
LDNPHRSNRPAGPAGQTHRQWGHHTEFEAKARAAALWSNPLRDSDIATIDRVIENAKKKQRLNGKVSSEAINRLVAAEAEEGCKAQINGPNPESLYLNDEVINTYFDHMRERDVDLCSEEGNRKKCAFFKTHLFPALEEQKDPTPEQVRFKTDTIETQTRKCGLQTVLTDGVHPPGNVDSFHTFFIPINEDQIHWVLGVVLLQSREITIIDSMGVSTDYQKNCRLMARYMCSITPTNPSDWTILDPDPSFPRQKNSK